MDLPRQYAYNPKWPLLIVGVLFFGAGAVVMGVKAAHNKVGVTINGIITLGPAGATILYWVLTVISAVLVLMALLLAAKSIVSPQILELGTDALLIPHGFLHRQTSRIAYAELERVWEVKASGQTFLYVMAGGRKFLLNASLLPDTQSYVAVREFLLSRVEL